MTNSEDKSPASGQNDENIARANIYALVAALLSVPPGEDALAEIAGYRGDDSDLGRALTDLATAASQTSAAAVEEEFNAVFIGVGEGEIVPFASHYLTGFLNEAPLAEVREAMKKLGIEREDSVKEPEDHLGFLFEIMAGLLNGTFGVGCDHSPQAFFDDHIRSWGEKALEDLEKAPSAVFYKPVAVLARRFLEIEVTGFRMAA